DAIVGHAHDRRPGDLRLPDAPDQQRMLVIAGKAPGGREMAADRAHWTYPPRFALRTCDTDYRADWNDTGPTRTRAGVLRHTSTQAILSEPRKRRSHARQSRDPRPGVVPGNRPAR